MNRVILVGRLVKDPELRKTNNDIAVVQFTLAVNRTYSRNGERTADFINCVAWRTQAENLAKYMRKAENLPWQEKNQMVQQITEDLSGVKQSILFIQGYMMMTKEELFKSINVVMDRQKSRNELQDPLGLQKNTEQMVERE